MLSIHALKGEEHITLNSLPTETLEFYQWDVGEVSFDEYQKWCSMVILYVKEKV